MQWRSHLVKRPENGAGWSGSFLVHAAKSSAPERKTTPVIEPGLQQWLKERGLPKQKVGIALYEHAGRGLEAQSRIRKGDVLLKIPKKLLITPEAVIDNSRTAWEAEKSGLPSWSLLAIGIAEARFAGEESVWKPYAQALPRNTGSILEWTDDEVNLLRGSQMHGAGLEILAAAETSVKEILPIIEKAEKDSQIEQGVLSEAHLKWAFSILLSRLVRLPGLNNVEALCPWADMINHDCRATAHLDYDLASKSASLVSDRSYGIGEQVMALYGQKTSGELLLSYGFAPLPQQNPHDGCNLSLSIAETDPLKEAKTAALKRYRLGATQEFPLRISGFPRGVVEYAAFMDAEPADEAETAELADWLFGRGQFPKLDGVDMELLGCDVLRDACKAALKNYPESMDAYQRSLKALQQYPAQGDSASLSSQNRKALITQVKLQEQKILQRSIFSLQQKLKALS